MAIALIVAIIGGLGYVILNRIERADEVAELCRLSFWVGLLAYLFGAVR
jgi:hypothetical protein